MRIPTWITYEDNLPQLLTINSINIFQEFADVDLSLKANFYTRKT